MSPALLDTTPATAQDSAANQSAAQLSVGEALRQQVAERLAAHRQRRAGLSPARASVQQAETAASARAGQIAAAVAQRYAKSQSYRAFLATEAERAVQQARAAAEVATLKARAMEAAQQSLLDALDEVEAPELSAGAPASASSEVAAAEASLPEELSFWPEAHVPARPHRHAPHPARRPAAAKSAAAPEVPATTPAPAYAVRMEHEVARPSIARETLRQNRTVERESAEMLALDEEIAMLHAPAFEEFIIRSEPLPANLIQFPRQLIAPRKARPRLAEGPLREDASETGEGQLRIFEVEQSQIATAPTSDESAAHTTEAQWTSIFLDGPRTAASDPLGEAALEPLPVRLAGAASVQRRAAAAAINTGIIGIALAAFGATAMWASGNASALRSISLGSLASMLPVAAAVAVLLCIAYQALFFTFSEATPGMRCVRLGLCTFADENPTRRSMRRRILAVLLSTLPFGLGFLWTILDQEKLSWHDRVSGMYLREY